MTESEINNRFDEINAKLDLVLQHVDNQRRRFQAVEDLMEDAKIVGYDFFNTAVDELEHNNIEINPAELKMLLLRLTKNIGNFNQLMGMFDSINDLIKDLGPIIHDLGLNTIETIAEYESKGYFKLFKNLSDNMDNILKIAGSFSNPQLINNLEIISRKISETSMDEKLDKKSLYGIFKELKSPEVRQTLGYTLRMIKELNAEIKQKNTVDVK